MHKIFLVILLLVFSEPFRVVAHEAKNTKLQILNDSIEELLASTLAGENIQALSTFVSESLDELKNIPSQYPEYKRTFTIYTRLADSLSKTRDHETIKNILLPISYFPSDSNDDELGEVNYWLGRSYLIDGNTDSAEIFLLKSEPSLQASSKTKLLDKLYNNLGVLYKNKAHFEESIRYYRMSLDIKLRSNSPNISKIYNNLTSLYIELGNFDSAYVNIQKCFRNTKDSTTIDDAYANLGVVYEFQGLYHPDSSLHFFHEAKKAHQEALDIRLSLKDTSSYAESYFNLGVINEYLDEYLEAEKNYASALSYDEDNSWSKTRIEVRENLAETYFIRGKYNKAINLIQDLEDLVINREPLILPQGEKAFLLESLDRKQKKYRAENINRVSIIIASFLGAICIILIITMIYRERLRRLKIQREIDQLKDKNSQERIDARDKILKKVGQDLHDELQNPIYAWKLGLCNTKDQETIENLNNISNKIRNISRQLNPPALVIHGIMPSLKELRDQYNEAYSFRVSLHSTSMERRRFSESVELCIYRIAQEALQNVEKHAKAKNVSLQLIHHSDDDEYISFVIEDDGIGFTQNPECYGMGILGMRERIEALRGGFDIDSFPGRGTIIIGEIPAEVKGLDKQ